MRALYDSEAKALQIDLDNDRPVVVHTEDIGHGAAVGLAADGRPVDVEILRVDDGIEAPLDAAAARYDLDRSALESAARAAIASADREVVLEISQAGSAAHG